jgi:TPR repeat protein
MRHNTQSPGAAVTALLLSVAVTGAAIAKDPFEDWDASHAQGNDYAVFRGSMYEGGHGVPKDYVEAVRWYRLAADRGHAAAQLSLGVMYQLGQGVPKDYVQAYMWFNLAAAQGDHGAAGLRDEIEKDMTLAQVAECCRRCASLVAGEEMRRRAASRLLLEIDVSERLAGMIADDEAGVRLLDGPGRREAAR